MKEWLKCYTMGMKYQGLKNNNNNNNATDATYVSYMSCIWVNFELNYRLLKYDYVQC